jgi:TatA/E family protein of Tat protein translocase
MNVSPAELMIALAVALVVFGPTRLPKLARSLGEAVSELRRAARDDREEADASERRATDPPTTDSPAVGGAAADRPTSTPEAGASATDAGSAPTPDAPDADTVDDTVSAAANDPSGSTSA